jgi:HK97 family phage major capsid protein/HK97 family phage prohead protease
MHGGIHFQRTAELGEPDGGDRIPVVLSSEHPVEREAFVEVLAHDSEANVDLRRGDLPLLVLHDSRKLPVGVIQDVRLDVASRVLRGVVKFASTTEAQELARQVRERTLRWVSVGYTLLRELGRAGRVTRFAWAPHEASLVAVPADPGAQFYRSHTPRIQMSDTNNAGDAGRSGDREAERLRQIIDLSGQYGRYVSEGEARAACQRGDSVEQFKETIMRNMESGHTDTSTRHVGLERSDVQHYSLARAILASVTGDWSKAGLEREASRAAEKVYGMAPAGFFVPSETWGRRDFNVGSASEAGNLVATDLRGDLFVDALREQMVLASLGARFLLDLRGNIDIPRVATPGSLGMLTEIGSASETAPVTAKLTLTPKRIGAYTEYSKQALLQSAVGLESLIRRDLVTGAAVLLENQIINGAGTGAHLLGLRNTTGIGTVVAGTAGATVAWSHFVDLEAACANANATPGAAAGYLSNSRVRAKAKTVQKGSSLAFIIDDAVRAGSDGAVTLNTYRAMFSNLVPSNLTKGSSSTVCSAALFGSSWGDLLIGLWGPPDVTVDPYTLAATGQVRITLNQFADAGARQPAAFAKCDDLLT